MPSGQEWAVALGGQSLARLDALGFTRDGDDAAALLARRSWFTGRTSHGTVSAGDACRMLSAADGWVAVGLPRPDDLELLPAWLGLSALGDHPPWGQIAAALAKRDVSTIVARGQELGLAIAVVGGDGRRDPDEQLRARGTEDPSRPFVRSISGHPVGPRCGRDRCVRVCSPSPERE
jgi:hypothetical protein